MSVINQGSIVWNKSFGMANVDDDVEVDENTKFMLASVSKTVTATALMQLWEDGLINLNQNISNYLPFEVIHPDYPNTPITARMLLAHTSGIRDNWGVMDYYPGACETTEWPRAISCGRPLSRNRPALGGCPTDLQHHTCNILAGHSAWNIYRHRGLVTVIYCQKNTSETILFVLCLSSVVLVA